MSENLQLAPLSQAVQAHRINVNAYIRKHAPKFFIEREPGKRWTCHLPDCIGDITCTYRVALIPLRGAPRVTFCYHMSCFEVAFDMADPAILAKIDVVAPNTYRQRGFDDAHVRDGKYLCDVGADLLIREWVRRRTQVATAHRSGLQLYNPAFVQNMPYGVPMNFPLQNTPFSPSEFQNVVPVTNYGQHQSDFAVDPSHLNLEPAPVRWSLTDNYLDYGTTDLRNTQSLSNTLAVWDNDKRYMFFGDTFRARGKLSDIDREHIRHLAKVPPIPGLQRGQSVQAGESSRAR